MESALGAMVAVVDEIPARTTVDDRRVEGGGDELGPHVRRDRPADDPAGEGVGDRGEVAGAAPRRQLGDVGDPEPVGPGGGEVAVDEVGEGCGILVADGRAHEPPAMDTREVVAHHEPRDPLARDVEAGLGEVGMDAGHPVRSPAAGMRPPDRVGEGRVGALPDGRAP